MTQDINTLEQIPPQSLETEKALLGCIFLDNSVILQVDTTPEMFYKRMHGHIFGAMKKLKSIDLLTVQNYLKEKGIEVSPVFLAELHNSVLTTSHFEAYAKIIREKYIRRTTIGKLSKNISDLYNEKEDTNEVMNSIKNGILDAQTTSRYLVEDNPELIEDWYADYDKPRILLKTGIETIDRVIGGFNSTDLALILADTNVGKTTLLMNMAVKMANAKKNVLFFSLEMSSEQLNNKFIAINSKLNAHDIYTRTTPKDHLHGAVKAFKQLPITIVSRGGITSQDVISEAYNRKLKGKVDIILLDYLQRLSDPSNDGETIRLKNIAMNLKNFALTNGIPIVTPAQVDKASSKGGKIKVENVAWAKALADEADVALYLYEKENKKSMIGGEETELRLKVVKSRHSAKGNDIAINFDKNTLRMTDFDYELRKLTKPFNK
ncbi:MAG TPA: hypothetical protein ENI08_02175 [Candidatus Dependentiae bacterium]|nr:hypothetical protein [Candidatus Dependentiae bacterium]